MRSVLGFLLWAAASNVGCVVYDPSLLNDAGADIGVVECDPRHVPSAPAVADGDTEVSFIFRDATIDQGDLLWQTIGYDLDGFCTSPADPRGSCRAPNGDPAPADGERGVDNAFGRDLLRLAVIYLPTLQQRTTDDMIAGRLNMVVSIRGWNGEDDDGRVDAFLAQTIRGESGAVGSGAAPLWDGNDRWWVLDSQFSEHDLALPLIRDDAAYITGRQFVMRLPQGRDITFPWDGQILQIQLTDGTITGQISADGTRLEDLTVTGRWALVDMNRAMTTAGLCPGSVERSVVDSTLRNAMDIRANPMTDGLDNPCDALSIAISFTGYRGTIAGLDVNAPRVPPCPDDAGVGPDAGM